VWRTKLGYVSDAPERQEDCGAQVCALQGWEIETMKATKKEVPIPKELYEWLHQYDKKVKS